MRRRVRLMRILKWSGTAGCVLIVAVSALSFRWAFGFVSSVLSVKINWQLAQIWSFSPVRTGGRYLLWSSDSHPVNSWSDVIMERTANGWFVALPSWLILLCALLPTLLFWFLDRRHVLPGHCHRCGYNLTGNTTDRCPECGKPT